jgi:hypothetical protein
MMRARGDELGNAQGGGKQQVGYLMLNVRREDTLYEYGLGVDSRGRLGREGSLCMAVVRGGIDGSGGTGNHPSWVR